MAAVICVSIFFNTFDTNIIIDDLGLGSARTDAIVVVYLQLAKNAKRVYATVANARTNNEGFRLEGCIHPSNEQQIELFKEVLELAKVNPSDVDYIESSACGHQVNSVFIFLLYLNGHSTPYHTFIAIFLQIYHVLLI